MVNILAAAHSVSITREKKGVEEGLEICFEGLPRGNTAAPPVNPFEDPIKISHVHMFNMKMPVRNIQCIHE